ncbi:hypothetical protein PR003_g22032 [Phytophthora rubi]|uniref:Uncharacterized protein n=1 Tax=Phytophthora rubi TaxID=129364 RepID=A0A6A4D852_9STRA|nr:hypothetical protein PR001_g20478 [Phytophthora rubi]KAE9303347.1 hypothetical protein PR003_g22032 [Phytophthora rubi]
MIQYRHGAKQIHSISLHQFERPGPLGALNRRGLLQAHDSCEYFDTALAVFVTMLGRNKQWCYVDYFQRKKERDDFTISKHALDPSESEHGWSSTYFSANSQTAGDHRDARTPV